MSRKRWVSAFVVVSCVGIGGAGFAQELPTPGPEHRAIGYFEGTWSFEGEAKDGPMGPGGEMRFQETCEWFEGGFALVCRSKGTGPMGPVSSLSIMSYDGDEKAYTYYAVEAGMPPFEATGKKDGKAWRWQTESKMGDQTVQTKVTVTEVTDASYTFAMEASMDGGATWQKVMEGKSTKSPT